MPRTERDPGLSEGGVPELERAGASLPGEHFWRPDEARFISRDRLNYASTQQGHNAPLGGGLIHSASLRTAKGLVTTSDAEQGRRCPPSGVS